ncbi:MAG: hypothetical protein Q9214_004275, partial [Letrouitia sp. 1 TL-2023]
MLKVKTPEGKKETRKFKDPIKCSPKIEPERAHYSDPARSSTSSLPKRQKTGFKQPPKAPPPKASPKSKDATPRFVVPPQAPSGESPSRNTRSRANATGTVAPRVAELHSVKDIRGLVGDVQAHLNVPLDPPASSVTISSGPSMDLDIDIDGSSPSTPLSSVPEIEESNALDEEFEFFKNRTTQRAESPKAKCPMCSSVVSRHFLEGYSTSDHLSLRQQARFCKAHKIRSAEQEWRDQGYPSIDWKAFEQRLTSYEHEINDMLKGDRKSFYRNSFEDQVKSGKDRTLQQALVSGSGWEGLKMGYYGSRGARVIMDYTMSTFASRIRRLAGSDKLINAAGVSGFVQAVLAPELAMLLVKDDMGVDDEQARVILRDSADIGNLLNEEEDEVIRDAEEQEQEEDDVKSAKQGDRPVVGVTVLKESVNDNDGESKDPFPSIRPHLTSYLRPPQRPEPIEPKHGDRAEAQRQGLHAPDRARHARARQHDRGEQRELGAVGLALPDAEAAEGVLKWNSETYERADGAAGGDGRDGAGADVAGDAAAGGEEGEEEGLGGGVVLRVL